MCCNLQKVMGLTGEEDKVKDGYTWEKQVINGIHEFSKGKTGSVYVKLIIGGTHNLYVGKTGKTRYMGEQVWVKGADTGVNVTRGKQKAGGN